YLRRAHHLLTQQERWARFALPTLRFSETSMSVAKAKIEPTAIHFADDGLVPNNPMPLLVYKDALALDSGEPEARTEKVVGSHGWGAMGRNGVYFFLPYHATVHGVLGIARGSARVRFGGDKGKVLEISAGDVAILPAGTGHQCLSAS